MYAIIVIAFDLANDDPWWESLLAYFVIFVAVFALFLIASGIVGGLRGMWRKFDL
jgi:hypothetical protein